MIEYVLLIVIVITMSSIVFVWMKTYVPKDDIKCQEGVSVYISDLKCYSKDGGYYLDLKIKNKGNYKNDVAGIDIS